MGFLRDQIAIGDRGFDRLHPSRRSRNDERPPLLADFGLSIPRITYETSASSPV